MAKVLILGGTGMLGGAVLKEFSGFDGALLVSSRAGQILSSDKAIQQVAFDAKSDSISDLLRSLGAGDYVINCIGVIKTEIDERSGASKQNAIEVNAVFPRKLAEEAETRSIRVIQIATDCAFSGRTGHYSETSGHDATDHYGLTKSQGEVSSVSMMHLRVSIIGPETRGHTSLYDWVSLQPRNAQITGYVNHRWNGIPAKHFGKLARGIVESRTFSAGVHHVIPQDEVTKCELVTLIAQHSGRGDIEITPGLAREAIDRTLVTNDPDFNRNLWANAGYPTPPTIADLVAEI
jgi:dTDP-4-dehydrorhamnose reductase